MTDEEMSDLLALCKSPYRREAMLARVASYAIPSLISTVKILRRQIADLEKTLGRDHKDGDVFSDIGEGHW